MSTVHTVEQGDHLSSIACLYGFGDYLVIWNHPQNADLKKLRGNPNVLLPGDPVFIPDHEVKQAPAATGKVHTFQVKVEPLMLRITVEDAFFEPIANAECELNIDGNTFPLVTNANGQIEHTLPRAAKQASLRIKGGANALDDELLPVRIGHLDPIDTVTGQLGRLNNLGYFAGSLGREDDALFRSAVEEFQCDVMGQAAVDGKCGPKTQAKLKEVHGC